MGNRNEGMGAVILHASPAKRGNHSCGKGNSPTKGSLFPFLLFLNSPAGAKSWKVFPSV